MVTKRTIRWKPGWFPLALAGILVLAASSQGQPPIEESPHDKIVNAIRRKGFKRVAVLPQAVVRKSVKDAQGDATVATKNTLGPLGAVWATELYEELVNSSGEDFEVVPQDAVRGALEGTKVSEIGQDDSWDLILKLTGADAIVYESVTDPGPSDGGRVGSTELGVSVQLIDAKKGSAAGSQSRVHQKSLSDAAYSGESFVVREYQNGKLEPTGLSGGPIFGVGLDAERQQYLNLLGGLGHPLTRSDFPYGIAVVADGEVRHPVEIDGRLYVPLSIGEKYQIQVWNRGAETTYAAVYVDGLNTIGQKRERPGDTETNRTWWLRSTPGRAATIEGWFNHDLDNNNRAKVNEFVVVGAEESLGKASQAPGEETFGASVGMITAIFYTYGTEGLPITKSSRLPPESTIGTGRGTVIDSRVSEFETQKKPKGLMLAAMTLYYRTPEQIEALKRELNEAGTTVSHPLDTAEPIDANDRPADSQVSRKEAEKFGTVIPPDETETPPASDPPPKKSDKDAKGQATSPKPRKKGELAPGSDKP